MQHPSRHKAPLLQGLSSKLHPATPGRPCAFPPPPSRPPARGRRCSFTSRSPPTRLPQYMPSAVA